MVAGAFCFFVRATCKASFLIHVVSETEVGCCCVVVVGGCRFPR